MANEWSLRDAEDFTPIFPEIVDSDDMDGEYYKIEVPYRGSIYATDAGRLAQMFEELAIAIRKLPPLENPAYLL